MRSAAGTRRQDRAVPRPGRIGARLRRHPHPGRRLTARLTDRFFREDTSMPDVTIAPTPYLKPLPDISDLNRPFWDALARHEFRVPRCADCGDYNWVPYPACRTCLSENLVWTVVSGDATVYSFSVVQRGPGAFDADVPYVLTLGQLVEEPRRCNVLAV